ncbi:MAG: hypothetical protein IMW89_13380 [Ktedonobacteraceae bacterium]|nr:hypothetical protein [Ktedonobacteraceae bacterium]
MGRIDQDSCNDRASSGSQRNYRFPHFLQEMLNTQTFAPVYVRDSLYDQRRLPPAPQESWAVLCLAWLRYHTTQVRWDIERALARLLRRRWR